MSSEVQSWEAALNAAMDLYADFREAEAEKSLWALNQSLKEGMDATPLDAERCFFRGRTLVLLEEPEQALLQFEQALQLDPEHAGALWETTQLLLETLDRPEGAKAILENRLIPLSPDSIRYQEALAAAETLIRRRVLDPKGSESGEPEPEKPV